MTRALRIDGVDLSNYQSRVVDYPEAKRAGVRYIYHKATEGVNFQDPNYARRRAEAKAAGIPFGAYHFAHPKVGNAVQEAEFFLAFANPLPGDMVPALDLEVNDFAMSEDELSVWVDTWFRTVFAHTGHEEGLYYSHMAITHRPKGVRLWASRYNNDNRRPYVVPPFRTWSVWQFSDGRLGVPSMVPGIGHVDIDTLHQRYPWARLGRLVIPGPKVKHRKPKVTHVETPIDTIVRLAYGQIGYKEKFANGQWTNIQKFSAQVPTLRWSQGQPWCCTFVSWLALKSDLANYYPCTASVREAMAWWKAKNQWSEYPAIGAQVIYGAGEHTGFVVGYDDTYVYAIEGNTNSTGGAEGFEVLLKKRLRTDPYVTGYGYPEIPGVRLKTADPHYYPRSN